tara:strand:+ start:159 stop:503 length:345 start_codon:yes stop_codon:yes gene_type:complete
MPNNIVKSFADKSGKNTKEVEKLWKKAESIVKDEYKLTPEDDDKFYSKVTGVLKKMLKLVDEEFGTGVAASGLTTGTPTGGAGLGIYAAKVGKVNKRKKKIFKEYLEQHNAKYS